MNTWVRPWLIICSGLTGLAGCAAGTGEGLDTNGRPVVENGEPGVLMPDFQSIQDNVFTPICTDCHVGGSAPVGLRLDQDNSFALLVGVASVEVPNLARIAAGDPDNSYLIQKIEGTAAVGGRMPLNGPRLPQATIDTIRSWVAMGAQAPEGKLSNGQLARVQSVTPGEGALLTALPPEIVIIFSKEMDVSTINDMTIGLSRSGGDGTFNDGNEVTVSASVALEPNTMKATIKLSGVTSENDVYELRVFGDGPSFVLDVEGMRLDGDDDGDEGGNFLNTFVVETAAASIQPTWH